jgi:D-beta-D-heptose 7-phosphate kinase/D-beta-D-heptose 1-phosphate adenosyltransferase
MKNFTSTFKNKKILVIGDVMLDEYIFGKITRKSPEAPKTPVILIDHKSYALGGAANVASNIAALGGTALLLGPVGDDENRSILQALINKAGITDCTFTSHERPTTVKTRLFEGQRQHARVDREASHPFSKKDLKSFSDALRTLPHSIDFVVISDYAKGTFSTETMKIILDTFTGDRIIVDPKPIQKNLLKKLLKNLHIITPNLKEMSLMAGAPLRRHADIRLTALSLAKELNTSVLATLGREGMILCEKGTWNIHRIPALKGVRAIDVTGAGDVATAACVMMLAAGAPLVEAARFANHVAAISVTKLGTSTVALNEIRFK